MKCCRPPSFSSAIMGRSWADHGKIMGRPWAMDSCRKILNISAFSDTVFFPKNYANLRFSHSPWTKRLVIFAHPVHVFLGKNAFILDRISILHLGIVCFHNNDSFYTLKPVCFAKICLIPRGRSCLAVRQSLKILFIENRSFIDARTHFSGNSASSPRDIACAARSKLHDRPREIVLYDALVASPVLSK